MALSIFLLGEFNVRATLFTTSFFALLVSVFLFSEIIDSDSHAIGNSVIALKTNGVNRGDSVSIILPDNLSDHQYKILNEAYSQAKKDGHDNPEILQGILLQETRAGGLKQYKVAGHEFGLGAGERYYGVAQIKKSAAKDVLAEYPELKSEYNFHTDTDEELIANLIMNDSFNISVASKYLLILKRRYNISDKNLIAAYNQGPGGFGNNNGRKYSLLVKRHLENFKK